MKKFNYETIEKFYTDQIVDVKDFNEKKLKDIIQIYCAQCGKIHNIIKKHFISSYLKKYNSGNENYKKCCSNLCVNLYLNKSISKKINCPVCNVSFISNNKIFCSHSCAAKHTNKNRILSETALQNLKNSGKIQSIKNFKQNNPKYKCDSNKNYTLTCKVCNKIFLHKTYGRKTCSDECYKIDNKINGKLGFNIAHNSYHRKVGRSYNEIYFFKLIKEIFPNALHNKFIFNGYDADVIIPELKLAIHWNGIWHYKPLINEEHFNKICNRDTERYNQIEKCGYKNYIIKDIKSKKDYNFVYSEFTKLLNILGITQL